MAELDFQRFKEMYQHEAVEEYPNKVGDNPMVSVMVVTYNHVNFIRECLEGILMQQVDFDYEILLGDDGSIDGTREICKAYAEKYPDKIRLFIHSRANNIKIDGYTTGRFNFIYNLFHARGKYLAMCEGDDYWTDPEKLRNQIGMLEQEQAFGSFHPVKKHYIRGSDDFYVDQEFDSKKARYFLHDLLGPWRIGTSSLVIRRDQLILPDWFPEVVSGDIAYVLSGIKDNYLIYYPQVASTWRIHDGGVSVPHRGIKKVMDMAVLYNHLNVFYNCRYREQIHKALEMEVLNQISKPREKALLEEVKAGVVLSGRDHVKAILRKLKWKVVGSGKNANDN